MGEATFPDHTPLPGQQELPGFVLSRGPNSSHARLQGLVGLSFRCLVCLGWDALRGEFLVRCALCEGEHSMPRSELVRWRASGCPTCRPKKGLGKDRPLADLNRVDDYTACLAVDRHRRRLHLRLDCDETNATRITCCGLMWGGRDFIHMPPDDLAHPEQDGCPHCAELGLQVGRAMRWLTAKGLEAVQEAPRIPEVEGRDSRLWIDWRPLLQPGTSLPRCDEVLTLVAGVHYHAHTGGRAIQNKLIKWAVRNGYTCRGTSKHPGCLELIFREGKAGVGQPRKTEYPQPRGGEPAGT